MIVILLTILALFYVHSSYAMNSGASPSNQDAGMDTIYQEGTSTRSPITLFGQIMAPNWRPLPVIEPSQQFPVQQTQAQKESESAPIRPRTSYMSNGSRLGRTRNGWYTKHSEEEAERIRDLIMSLHDAEEWTDYYNEKAKKLTPEQRILAVEGDQKLKDKLGPQRRGPPIRFSNKGYLAMNRGEASSNPPNDRKSQKGNKNCNSHHKKHRD